MLLLLLNVATIENLFRSESEAEHSGPTGWPAFGAGKKKNLRMEQKKLRLLAGSRDDSGIPSALVGQESKSQNWTDFP